jgi:ankyrin repeat protein
MRSSEHLASPDKTPLLMSVMKGHADCAQLLIDAGALLDVQCGPDLETALHVCCARGMPDLAQQLIAGGANLCKADSIGRHAAQRVEP